MPLNRRHFLASASLLTAGACATRPEMTTAPDLVPSAPLKISEDRVTHVTVCTRPFRPSGPRLEAKQFADKTVIHNYGHGGSGWSLSWGCAEQAATLAMATGQTRFAVIGAGVIGLTSAIQLAQMGTAVTIYAKDFPSETRSAKATGVWSPSSRIALHAAAPDGFEDSWERWARSSFPKHQAYMGAVGEPVRIQPFYPLRSAEPSSGAAASRDFMHLDRLVQDLMPGTRRLAASEHRFPVAQAQQGSNLAFNIEVYTEHLLRDFFEAGGQMVRQDFHDHNDVLDLSELVIVNCTGYGAKTLWGADELEPVRGQINWLPAQAEAAYGLFYKNVYVISRGDGLVVQYVGENDDFGFGIEDETPDPEELQTAVQTIAPLFAGWETSLKA